MCNNTDANHRRSPLVQGGLEIPMRVMVAVELGESKVQAKKRYVELVNEHYEEQVNGLLDHVMTSVHKALASQGRRKFLNVGGTIN